MLAQIFAPEKERCSLVAVANLFVGMCRNFRSKSNGFAMNFLETQTHQHEN
jgi:hypothetical protein